MCGVNNGNEARPLAIVTGGARRVGRACVLELARAGFDVMLTFHASVDEAEKTACEARERGAHAEIARADFERPDEAARVVAEHVAGRPLAALVNNASLYCADEAGGPSVELCERHMRVNLVASLRLTLALADQLRAAGGCVVNFVDVAADRPYGGYVAYSASKAALANATLSLARALAPAARCVGVAPGVIAWPEEMPEAARAAYLKRVPLARAGTPEDAARLVRFLVTEGSYVNGEIVRLDGGRGAVP